MSDVTPGVIRAAERLSEAERLRMPTEPVAGLLTSIEEAYAVQAILMGDRETPGNPLLGRKVGLTSTVVQRQLGVDQPDFGVLLADMQVPQTGVVDMSRLIQPKIEAEIAFVLGRDVDDLEPAAVLAAVAWVAPALEIVDSRIGDWRITLFDTVADNASSAMFHLGQEQLSPHDVDLPNVRMSMTVNGLELSTGRGADCLDNPVNALAWVARMAASQGRPLRAGEIVLSGALGPMVTLDHGAVIEATFSGMGTATVRASDKEAS